MEIKKALTQLYRIGKEHLDLYMEEFNKGSYEAMKDFTAICFYRFRSDTLSDRYIALAKQAIDKLTHTKTLSIEKVALLDSNGEKLVEEFRDITASVKKADKGFYKTNKNDEKLLRSICNDFIPKLREYDYNVRNFAKRYLDKAKIKELSEEFREITCVGHKLSSVCLRDLFFFYINTYPNSGLSIESLSKEQIQCLFPVDTWIRNLCRDIFGIEGSDDELMDNIIKICESADVSPVYVNHGLWYRGARGQELLINNLANMDCLSVKEK